MVVGIYTNSEVASQAQFSKIWGKGAGRGSNEAQALRPRGCPK